MLQFPCNRIDVRARQETRETVAIKKYPMIDQQIDIALHTSPIMSVALPMYLKMGFAKAYDAPPIFGVACAVYTKAL